MHANVERAVVLLLVLSLFLGNATATLENTKFISLSNDSVELVASLSNHSENDVFKQRINLAPFNYLKITVTDVPSDIWFIILQIHTFQSNATLSYDKELLDKASHRSVFGSNIGLYLKTHNATAPIQVFLKHHNTNDLEALLVIVTYGRNAPIPGGCNVKFDLEASPYQELHIQNEIITKVDTESAAVLAPDGSPISCKKSEVQYKLYRLYLLGQDFTPDIYFDAIARMLTTQDIVRNGDKIKLSISDPATRSDGMGTGIGSIYAIVAIYENYSSAYVPIFTYACNPLLYRKNLQHLNDTITKCTALLTILMCLLIIIEHKYPRIGLLGYSVLSGTCGYAFLRSFYFSHEISILSGLEFAVCTLMSSERCVTIWGDFSRCNRYAWTWLRHFILCSLSICMTYICIPASYFVLKLLMNDEDVLTWVMVLGFVFLTVTPTVLTNLEQSSNSIVSDVTNYMGTWLIFALYLIMEALNYYIESNNSTMIIKSVTIPGYYLACLYPSSFSHFNLIFFIISPSILILTKRYASSLLSTADGRFSPKKDKLKHQDQVKHQDYILSV